MAGTARHASGKRAQTKHKKKLKDTNKIREAWVLSSRETRESSPGEHLGGFPFSLVSFASPKAMPRLTRRRRSRYQVHADANQWLITQRRVGEHSPSRRSFQQNASPFSPREASTSKMTPAGAFPHKFAAMATTSQAAPSEQRFTRRKKKR